MCQLRARMSVCEVVAHTVCLSVSQVRTQSFSVCVALGYMSFRLSVEVVVRCLFFFEVGALMSVCSVCGVRLQMYVGL